MSSRAAAQAALLGLMGLSLTVGLPGATAQTIGSNNTYQAGPVKRGPIERTVDGKVTGKNDAPLSGAVVYLKDSKSMAVKTYLTDDAGHFHFGQLGQNTDYELWAESDSQRSKSKSISSFDSKNSYYFTLKVDKAK
jgi:hypothetical protein